MNQVVLGGSLHWGMQGKRQGQLEGGMHLGRLDHTCHCLLAGHLGKAHLDKALGGLQGQKEMVQLGKEQDLQVAVLELLLVDNAQGTAQELQDWMEIDLELLVQVDIVQVSQDQGGSHQVPKEVLGIALVLQDLRGMGTAPVPLGQMIHQGNRAEQRAGWGLQELN